MAELIVTDGIALLKFSRSERVALGRDYLAFSLNGILKASIGPTPSKAVLGKKSSLKRLPFSRTGEYVNEDKRSLYIGPRKKNCVRVLLVSTQIDVLYLTFGDLIKVCARLNKKW